MSIKKTEISFAQSLLEGLTKTEKPTNKAKSKIRMFTDLIDEEGVVKSEALNKASNDIANRDPLIKMVMNQLNGAGAQTSIERLAFEGDPTLSNRYSAIYKAKERLLPNNIIKRISVQDDLVAACIRGRGLQASAFGRPQPDRFSSGFKINPLDSESEDLNDEAKNRLNQEIAKIEKMILACGKTDSITVDEALNFSQYLQMSVQDIMRFGCMATEAVYDASKKFHSFRPIDAGTIFKAVKQRGDSTMENIRDSAVGLLKELNGNRNTDKKTNIDIKRFANDEYTWVQVVNDRPLQVFTDEECLVHNFYPTTDIEMDGYPLTPLDTIVAAVTTHINITTHNKLYFQSGRAAKGMLVFESDDIDDAVLRDIKQKFNASINSVSNAHRTPVFAIGTGDRISWQAIDSSGRDMEFQYLSDNTSRIILSGFQMSPDEIPGYSHLSKGTNSQALSESSNEFKLEAHRDLGIRPLLAQLQDFINARILPLIAPELCKKVIFQFVGLDAETAEKESARLQEDSQIHMTFNDLLGKVDKKPISVALGGNLPLNPTWNQAIAPFVTVGYIREHLLGIVGAAKDPRFDYVRDPMYFQAQNLQMQKQQAVQQQQMQEQQAAMAQQQQQQPNPQQPEQLQESEGGDFTNAIGQLTHVLSKSEKQLSPEKRKLLAQERATIERNLKAWDDESQKVLKEAIAEAKKHIPAKIKK